MKKRYFFVSYAYYAGNAQGHGNAECSVDEGFPNKKELITSFKQAVVKKQNLNFNDIGIVILNIVELSEADYNDWKS